MKRITLAFRDADVWLAFRMACLKRRLSASEAIARLIRTQLQQWEEEDMKQQRRSRREPST